MHELDKTIDNNFYAFGNPNVTITGEIGTWRPILLSQYKLSITTKGG